MLPTFANPLVSQSPSEMAKRCSIRPAQRILIAATLAASAASTPPLLRGHRHPIDDGVLLRPRREHRRSLDGAAACSDCGSADGRKCVGRTVPDESCDACSSGQAFWPCNLEGECWCWDTSLPRDPGDEDDGGRACSGCGRGGDTEVCVANQNSLTRVEDAECDKCVTEGQSFWPCDDPDLCWCWDTTKPKKPPAPASGLKLASDLDPNVPAPCEILTREIFMELAPNSTFPYTYDGLCGAIDDYNSHHTETFAAMGSEAQVRAEIAAFLGNTMHESDDFEAAREYLACGDRKEVNGKVYCKPCNNDSYDWPNNTCSLSLVDQSAPYNSYCQPTFEPPEGCVCDTITQVDEGGPLAGYVEASKVFYGRGAIQLSWNYNYIRASYALTGKAETFCEDPELVATEPEYAWGSAIYFWMENQKEGTTCHKEALKGDFGGTLSNINGGLECPAYKGGWHADAIKARLNRYCHAAIELGLKALSSLEGCKGMPESYEECLGDGTCPYCEQYAGIERDTSFGTTVDATAVTSWPTREEEEEEEEGDWSEVVADWAGGDEEEDDEDWSETSLSSMKLYCGKTRFDALQNCGRNGYECPDGVCLNDLACFAVDGDCATGDGEGENESVKPSLAPSAPVSSDITSNSSTENLSEEEDEEGGDDDWSETSLIGLNLYCGKTRSDALQNCGRNGYECPDGVCLNDLACFAVGDDCPAEDGEAEEQHAEKTLKPSEQQVPATAPPTPKPTAIDNTGLREQFCATSLATIQTECITAKTCKTSSDCPSGKYCWGARMCGSTDPPTSSPVAPTAYPSAQTLEETARPTMSIQVDIQSSFFCGSDRAHASTSCHKRCQNGSECDEGETCFGYTSCKAEVTRQPQHQSTSTPASSPTNLPSSAAPTASPTSAAPTRATTSDAAPRQFFCASSKEELETSCETAQSCASGPCPEGTFCFPFSCAAGTAAASEGDSSESATADAAAPPKGQPLERSLFCAASMADLETSCETAQSCASGPCPSGEFCFPFTCASSVASEGDGSTTAAPTTAASATSIGQPLEKSLFCATSMTELETSCNTAQRCSSGPCQSGHFCFPFTCKDAVSEDSSLTAGADDQSAAVEQTPPAETPRPQSLAQFDSASAENKGLCPQSSFVGWHTTADCTEYFECAAGSMGPVYSCEDSQKFDKVRGKCVHETYVNSFCYGPPEEDRALCKEGYTGWASRNICREYFWCIDGHADYVYDCGEGLLFDTRIEICNLKSAVKCIEKGGVQSGTSTPDTQTSPAQSPSTMSSSSAATNGYEPAPSSPTVGGGGLAPESTPTASQNTTEIPPWLMYGVADFRNGAHADVANNVWLLIVTPMLFMF